MSNRLTDEQHILFRDLLKKVGSGTHTSKSLSREEAADATEMMLQQAATPAQIGAFMIAHRIKRPTPIELAGMLDSYDALGPRLKAIDSVYPVTVFCNPYDGRSRTAPINPLTALILVAADAPVILHGSGRMPTKHGLPLIEVFNAIGLDWTALSTLEQLQTVFAQTGLGFVYQPIFFPLAEALVDYREQIGKRPTLATVEIMWSPYSGRQNVVSGYVHPPTEERTQVAFTERGINLFTTVKGLEGSCDVARDRTAIISLNQLEAGKLKTERLLLHPKDYGFEGSDPAIPSLERLWLDYQAAIAGRTNEISCSAIWNSGFYLWRASRVSSIEQGFELARSMLESGAVEEKLQQIKLALDTQTTQACLVAL
ncbi:Glycosyl transferase family, helical bundle domain protein [Synechococcus sp. PCC 7335]|uniref:anthranilate phosphoribosyltransferase family protein n=1 Tax=Synechococcus sp. (strain ATCC 29403 / PCC 7335) TaxID=91464 RepID=UPI00017EBC63|nr:anthranilate phosphoribosyltransferase family protein [Synechococcus sp. PCC 7335]EDX85762.1 Glycosyl transferase family, helical bundle domain protein [Synechococcus sp. PCC 7335]